MSPARVDVVSTLARKLRELDWNASERAFRAIEKEAQKVIAATLIGKSKVTVERAADLRFVGQGFELVTTLPRGPYTRKSLDGIRDAFLAEYKRMFQQVPPVGEIEIINIRVALTAPIGRAELKVAGGKGAAS